MGTSIQQMIEQTPACSRRRLRWTWSREAALTLGLLVVAESLSGADLQRPTRSPGSSPARKTEIKLFVTAANVEQAIKALKLDEHRAVKEIVCFFDTSDGALETSHLILRARQMGDGPGEFTVKLRATEGATELSDAERAIQPEQDWTSENEPTHARSVVRDSLARGLVSRVVAGQLAVAELFNEAQRKLVTARMKGFNMASLRRYGPVEALVWRQQWRLQSFPEKVTVELWHLQKDDQRQDVLEVSANAKAETEDQAQSLARQFFAAARAAGLGEPTGQTKTRKVMDFFKPGR